ncbi:MAG: type II toxin-antitoxin system VapC family toxin [Betaproteobacteria bacterium]|nr:type II toxin-antitoxin system VapC family toxin [Betaproteobacteria bacterium]
MRILLDTHVLLWALNNPARLGKKAVALLSSSEVFASTASMWEISIKVGLGKLKAHPQQILDAIEPAGFDLLPVQAEHAVEVFSLGALHGDPFDRLLVAQARVERMELLTFDEALLQYGPFVRSVDA